MIPLEAIINAIEAPQPLLPADQFPIEDQKPLYFSHFINFIFNSHRWTIKKLSMARCGVALNRKSSTKSANSPRSRPLPYTEPEISEKIPIVRVSRIIDPKFHERIIYESYKATNLREMQDYMHFMLAFRKILPNQILHNAPIMSAMVSPDISQRPDDKPQIESSGTVEEILESPEVSKEIKNYYNSEIQTRLPEQLGIF